MADWGVKYRVRFDDIHNTHPAKWKVDFLFKGYHDFIHTLRGSSDPLVITRGKDTEDRMEPVLGSSVEINIIVEDEKSFIKEDFYLLEEFDVKCIIYKDEKVYWTGFCIPEFCEYPYTTTPYVFKINATDGLSGLKSKTPNMANISNEKSLVKILDLLLTEGLWQAQDGEIQKTKILSSIIHADNNLFDLAYVKQELFLDGDSNVFYKNIYDIINIIATSLGCRIFTSDGSFWIQRITDMAIDYKEGDIMNYTPEKSTSKEKLYQILKGEISSSDMIYIDNFPFIYINPAYKIAKNDVNYVMRTWLQNWNWQAYNSFTHFDHWKVNIESGDGSGYEVVRHGSGTEADPYTAFIPELDGGIAAFYQDIQDVPNKGIIKIDFDVNFINVNILEYEIYLLDYNQDPNGKEIAYWGYEVDHVGITGEKVYRGPQWVPYYWDGYKPRTDASKFKIIKDAIDTNKNVSIETTDMGFIYYDQDNPGEINGIRFKFCDPYQPFGSSPHGVEIGSVKLSINPNDYIGEIDTVKTIKGYSKNVNIENDLLLTCGKYYSNHVYLNPNADFHDYGVACKAMSFGISKLQLLNLYTLMGLYNRPYELMKGTYFSNTVEFYHVVQRAFGEYKLFLQMYDEYHVKECRHKMTLAEIFPFDLWADDSPVKMEDFIGTNNIKYKTK